MHDSLALYIDGKWTKGSSGQSGAVINPATGKEIGRVPFAAPADLGRALEAAQRGYNVWRKVLPQERARVVRAIATLLRERTEDLAQVMTLEQGKPLAEARGEVATAVNLIEWLAEESRRIYGRVVPSRFPDTRTLVLHEPVGPVAAFAPWNFPCMMPARKIAHALAAGCSIIVKPAEETPGTAMALAKICEQVGLPPGVVNIVFGVPAEVSRHLIQSPIIRKVSLTGSTAVGREIAALASRDFKRVTLELGGHSPVIVCADADLDRALELSVEGRFRNAGQVCIGPSRFIVHESAFDRFAADFSEAAQAIRVGNGLDPQTQMGPLANARRIDAVEALVADAEKHGGKIHAGGHRIGNQGFFFAPTVLTGVSTDARLLNVEPFGPLAHITPFSDLDEAIAEANRVPYGLAAYAFTRSQPQSARLSAELEAGVVAINGMTVIAPEGPFGGVKDSGLGRESGIEGLMEYMSVKTVTETFA